MTKRTVSDELFILGAGFSKALYSGFPTLKELGIQIINTIEEDSLKKHLETIPSGITENLETLLSYLIVDMPWKSPSKRDLDMALFKAILPIISKTFLTIHKTPSYPNMYDFPEIESLIDHIHQNDIPILSFNYDLCIESLFSSKKSKTFKIEGGIEDKGYSLGYNLQIKFISKKLKSKPDIYSFEETQIQSGRLMGHSPCYSSTLFIPNIYEEPIDYKEIELKLTQSLKPYSNFPESFFQLFATKLRELIKTEITSRTTTNYPEERVSWGNLYKMPLTRIGSRSGKSAWDGHKINTDCHLLKLHGSINWYYSGTNAFPSEQLYYSINLNEVAENTENSDLSPFIIPPILDKNQFYFHSALRHLWFKAGEYLKNAKTIYFIGYSLPETDIASKLLFQENIRNAKVIVVNKTDEKQTLIDRYSQLFPKCSFDFNFVDNNDVLYEFIKQLS